MELDVGAECIGLQPRRSLRMNLVFSCRVGHFFSVFAEQGTTRGERERRGRRKRVREEGEGRG